MHRFVHLADAHLGAHREPNLQKLELQAFDTAMSKCVELGVDFVLVCGDLFHVGIPDLAVVKSAIKSMKLVLKEGIPIYAIYGSHDYTPTGTSVIDILDTAGVIVNVFKPSFSEDRLALGVTVDGKTGAKIAGISARRIGLESGYYEALDRASLEQEKGFKVFMFHSGLSELKPADLREMETISVELLPRGFDYYAGGHIHERGEFSVSGFDNVVFPGPLFTGHGRDLEASAKGEKRGVYVVDFDDTVRSKRFLPIDSFEGIFREYDLTGRNAREASAIIRQDLQDVDVSGRLVVLRAYGELSGGRVGDVEFGGIRTSLDERGAIHVYVNRHSLRSREATQSATVGQDPVAIERILLTREAGRVSVSTVGLRGEAGAAVGIELLRILREQPKLGEPKRDYLSRMVSGGRKTLSVKEVEAES